MTSGEPSRPLHGASFGSGFGHGAGGWNLNGGGIWGNNTAIGSGLKGSVVDAGRMVQEDHTEAIKGSGSLLPSSESDNWAGHHASQWKPVDSTSPTLSSSHTNRSTSPMRRQSSNQLRPPSFVEPNPRNVSFFTINPGATSKPSQKPFLDPTSGSFVAANPFDPAPLDRSSRQNSDDNSRYPTKPLNMEDNDMGMKLQPNRQGLQHNISGYNSGAASRSGSLPPSRNGGLDPSRFSDDPVNSTPSYSHLAPSGSASLQRQNHSIHVPTHAPRVGPYGQRQGSQSNLAQVGVLAGDLNKLNLGRENNQSYYFTQQQKEVSNPSSNHTTFGHDFSHQLKANDPVDNWVGEENGYQANHDGFASDGVLPGGLLPHSSLYRGIPFPTTYPHSPSNSDPRRNQQSLYYSTRETPPSGIQHRAPPRVGPHVNGAPNGQAALLDRKLRGLQQEQHSGHPSQPNSLQFRTQYAPSYEFHPQTSLRMNPLAPFYHMPAVPSLLATPVIPRGPAREHDVGQHVRSVLLEEFRTSGKTNKRYELKDIYNHIVEFSGDQHGSRFIQQKLETANSDEKDQVFREIRPNSLQLMTDVFGNYVIQKFFEHGNQGQKKILAGQMKNHILTLSLQMYGCRVVQKALEHILTDQQALLVKELEHHVLKCVKDQNGNHVVQKAIERVPAEHIQFIINAFTGQVHGLATHPYGCRVIQRMLEHCEEPTRSAVLQELHACAPSLIIDQYGNYVTQHVIEHGREGDRAKVISLITGNLVNFSKHKFASNVVEKSIEFGTADQRGKIIDTLTALNEKGESPLQSLIRDQYGNYVIQKLLTQLKDAESDQFIELIKPQLALLKRFSYGKQIAAIEKTVYHSPTPLLQVHTVPALPPPIDTSAAPTPPLLASDAQSPQSVSLPSTNASSIDGLVGSRKSSASNTLEVVTPTST